MSLDRQLICVSICCDNCGDMWSSYNMRGSSKFIREHIESCEVESFNIQKSYDYEVIE